MTTESKPLSAFFTLRRGRTYKSELLGLPGPVLLGLATIDRDGGFRTDSLRTYGGDSPEDILVQPGELYVSLKDVTQSGDLLGAVARLPVGHSPGRLTQDTVKLQPLASDAPLDYLYWVLRTPQYRTYCRSRATGTTNLGLSRDDFLSFLVPRPAQREDAIVEALDAVEAKIGVNRRMSQTLESIAQAIFKSWFVDFEPVYARQAGEPHDSIKARLGLDDEILSKFPDDFQESEQGPMPCGWVEKPISELAEVVGGSTPSTKEASFWDGGLHFWATPKDLSLQDGPVLLSTERSITEKGLAQIGSGLLKPGTVLLSSRAPIGYRAIAEVPVAINQGFIALLPRPGVPSLFLLRWLETAHEEIVSRANGSTFLEISKSAFRPIRLAVPPDALLTAYAKACEPLYRRVVANELERRTLVQQRDALLPELLSGRVEIGHLESLP